MTARELDGDLPQLPGQFLLAAHGVEEAALLWRGVDQNAVAIGELLGAGGIASVGQA
ncbi:hypothetical protein OG339_48865 (plasmid) [Streptosporangium sp. NBC_01495]|uniref:hypothetical protein n=1 Tax=Streptosporangium sp. NBC_01495 TaxID=2903899 RepID=UPI002E3250B2|nr:hypothetical protein [Streptosporangium sp. NBC_01495]